MGCKRVLLGTPQHLEGTRKENPSMLSNGKKRREKKKRIKPNISEETNNSSLKSPNSTKDINHFVVKPINREESEQEYKMEARLQAFKKEIYVFKTCINNAEGLEALKSIAENFANT